MKKVHHKRFIKKRARRISPFRPLTKIVEQGYKDFTIGQVDNPYNLVSLKGKEWQRGFNNAYFDNLKGKYFG